MNSTERGVIVRELVLAEVALHEARDKLCGVMIRLPDSHPIRAEVEKRWRALYADKLGDATGDGLFFNFTPLVFQFCEAEEKSLT